MTKHKPAIAAISYLNTKPFLYGLYAQNIEAWAEMDLTIPAQCAQRLLEGSAQIGLVPVAVIPQLPQAQIISDYCISAVGQVNTVAIFAERPLEELTHLYLDYQSRSSVALARHLLREYWRKDLVLLPAQPGYEWQLKDRVGGVVIGDRTIGLSYSYKYDLAEAWRAHTGLPFVFAAWVATTPLSDEFLAAFNAALCWGVERRVQVARLFQSAYEGYDVEAYFTQYIQYDWTAEKRRAMELFWEILPKAGQ
jgi:chorismate dehydratase